MKPARSARLPRPRGLLRTTNVFLPVGGRPVLTLHLLEGAFSAPALCFFFHWRSLPCPIVPRKPPPQPRAPIFGRPLERATRAACKRCCRKLAKRLLGVWRLNAPKMEKPR